jgi:hypothetical protein
VGKFLALGHATRPSYGGPKIDPPDFPVDFALWNFASVPAEPLSTLSGGLYATQGGRQARRHPRGARLELL